MEPSVGKPAGFYAPRGLSDGDHREEKLKTQSPMVSRLRYAIRMAIPSLSRLVLLSRKT